MPIRQHKPELDRSSEHMEWLKKKFTNVESEVADLNNVFEAFENTLNKKTQDQLTMANTRSRLRMVTLYAFATHNKLLVAGTGNKVEDFGVGFFTKYGDGGVDLSPIADLLKSEVYEIAKELGICNSIMEAAPTDGLFADSLTDEDHIGASYPELEWAMNYIENNEKRELSERQQKVLDIYKSRNKANKHKVEPIPVCVIPSEFKK